MSSIRGAVRLIVSALFITLSLAGSAHALLLSPAERDAARLLPPPPRPGSPAAKAEVAELHAIAERSAPDVVAAAARDAMDQKPDMFNEALGFDAMALPATARLLTAVFEEQAAAGKSAKAFFHRDRPWIVDPTIRTCTKQPPGPAANTYPSGHSTTAFSLGVVLAALMPENAQIILARAGQAAENRLICGMHFRSDIVAGQQFGTALALRLMEKPAFKAQMAAARAELRAAHHLE
jgi:acid phosphatase (class A)